MDPSAIAMLSGFMQNASSTAGNVINFVSQLLTNKSNRQNVDNTNAANAQLAQQANQWSIEQWNRENAYNTPAAQIQRFRDAGLNPSLIYGQENLAANSPAVSSAAGTQAPAMLSAPTIDPYVGLQEKLINAQANKLDTESKVMKEKLPKELQQLDSITNNIVANTNKVNTDIEVLLENKALVHEDARRLMLENQFLMRTLDDRVKIVQHDEKVRLVEAKYIEDNMRKQLRVMDKTLEVMQSQKELNEASKNQLEAVRHQIMYHGNKEIDAMTRYYDKQTGYVGTKTVLAPVEAFTGLIREGTNAVVAVRTGKQPPSPYNPWNNPSHTW